MLAIVIPFFKIEFFHETLASLANQSCKKFHVYIGDDASPDDLAALLSAYDGSFSFTYRRFATNLGSLSLSKQWERCIGMIQGEEWIMILGDDDVLAKNAVEEWHVNYFKFRYSSNVVRFASQLITERSELYSKVYKHPEWEKATHSFYRKFKGFTRSSLSEYTFKKKSFIKHKFEEYPVGWHSDDKAWIDFSGKNPIYSINNAIVYVRGSSISVSGMTDNLSDKQYATMKFYRFIVTKQLKYFPKKGRIELVRAFERNLLKVKKPNINELFFLTNLNIQNFEIRSFRNFLSRSLSLILKDT